ncbi:MAG: hypothetical protein ACI93R_001694 [Flavobacteriales bacterium]|jgi:hypothetical protein
MPKNKYLCILRSESGKCEPPSPAQMEEMYAKFNAWKDKYKDNIIDMGGKLSADGKVMNSEGVTDGPFVEAKEIIGGFMIIGADDIDEAMQVVREGPGIGGPGTSVELRAISTP